MNFGMNLVNARRAKGMSQEELAEKLYVSRQTIYKWESGVTYPDIDKLSDIAKYLDVTTAYLLGEEGEQVQQPCCAPSVDKQKVLRHFKGFANAIGLCTLSILFGVALFVCIGGLGGDGKAIYGLIPFLGIVFAAVIGYVVAGILHEQFTKENVTAVSFEKEEKSREQRSFTVKIAVALALIFAGVLFVVLAGVLDREQLSVIAVTALLALIGIACYLFITAGILHELYAPEKKAKKSSSEEAVSGAIMTLATAAFLVMGFVWNLWHPAWVVFPVGGVLSGCVSSLLQLRRGKNESADEE